MAWYMYYVCLKAAEPWPLMSICDRRDLATALGEVSGHETITNKIYRGSVATSTQAPEKIFEKMSGDAYRRHIEM